jgi:hypothetical protein
MTSKRSSRKNNGVRNRRRAADSYAVDEALFLCSLCYLCYLLFNSSGRTSRSRTGS